MRASHDAMAQEDKERNRKQRQRLRLQEPRKEPQQVQQTMSPPLLPSNQRSLRCCHDMVVREAKRTLARQKGSGTIDYKPLGAVSVEWGSNANGLSAICRRQAKASRYNTSFCWFGMTGVFEEAFCIMLSGICQRQVKASRNTTGFRSCLA